LPRPPTITERIEVSLIFKVFDHDMDGFISEEDLKKTLEALKLFNNNEELKKLCTSANFVDGKLDYEKFSKFYCKLMKYKTEEEEEKKIEEEISIQKNENKRLSDFNGTSFLNLKFDNNSANKGENNFENKEIHNEENIEDDDDGKSNFFKKY
jgi:Ca2+-binding EF-hand superfamily protein